MGVVWLLGGFYFFLATLEGEVCNMTFGSNFTRLPNGVPSRDTLAAVGGKATGYLNACYKNQTNLILIAAGLASDISSLPNMTQYLNLTNFVLSYLTVSLVNQTASSLVFGNSGSAFDMSSTLNSVQNSPLTTLNYSTIVNAANSITLNTTALDTV